MAAVAVLMMIAVAFTPIAAIIADDQGSDAATGTVLSNLDVELYTTTSDLTGLVYYNYGQDGTANNYVAPTGISMDEYYAVQDGSTGNYFFRSYTTQDFLTYGDIPGYTTLVVPNYLPLIQVVGDYSQGDVNDVDMTFVFTHGTSTLTVLLTGSSADYGTDGLRQFLQNAMLSDIEAGDLAGDYVVTITATQGVTTQTVTKTVSNGVATTVSGYVKDYDGAAISGATVTLSGTTSGTATTDSTGKYSFIVASGSVAAVAVSYSGGAYTFGTSSYSFGTVTSSVTHDFAASQKTTTITITDATGGYKISGAQISYDWYSEKTVSGVTTVIQSTTGTHTLLSSVTDANGAIKIAYTVPTDEGYTTHALVVSIYSAGSFTNDVVSLSTGSGVATIATQLSGHAAMGNAATGALALKTVEKTITVSVLSSNSQPVANVAISAPVWYRESLTGTTYTLATDGLTTTGNTFIIGTTDSTGKITVAYSVPVLASGYTGNIYLYISALDSGGDPVVHFAKNTIVTGDSSTSITSKVTSAGNKVMTASSITAVSLLANEKMYKISGTVEGATASANAITYTTPTSNTTSISSTGTYQFYVLDLTVTTVSLTSLTGYTPVGGYSLGTVSADKVANFTKVVAPVATGDVNYVVDFVDENGDIIDVDGVELTFAYSVGTQAYSAIIVSENGVAKLTLALPLTASVSGMKATVTTEGAYYIVSAFDGYVALATDDSANVPMTINVWTGSSDVPTGFPVEDELKMLANVPVTIKTMDNETLYSFTTDENGFASFTVSAEVAEMVYLDVAKVFIGDTVVANDDIVSEVDGASMTAYLYIKADTYYQEAIIDTTVDIGYRVFGVADTPFIMPGVGDSEATIVDGKIAVSTGEIAGYSFVGWYVNDVLVSSSLSTDLTVINTDSVYGVYAANSPAEPAEISNIVLILCIIAVIIALIAVVYAVIAKKKE